MSLAVDSWEDHPAPDVLVLALVPGSAGAGAWVADAHRVEERFGLDLSRELDKASGVAGDVVAVALRGPSERPETLLLVGVGDQSPLALRRAGAAVARRVKRATRVLSAVTARTGPDGVRAFVEGVLLGAYAVPRFAAADRDPDADPPEVVVLAPPGTPDAVLHRAGMTATAARRSRDLANTPPNLKDPQWLASQAVAMGSSAGVSVRVRDEDALAAEGFGGLLAVGAGSSRPPRLIEMRYDPADPGARPHVVLVGKGITFDSGGLSLKPREAMLPMKTDMTGGGAVLAVLAAVRDLGVPVRVTGLVAAAENLPGAAAVRPGDVITHYGGRTSEVLNTDAEGRLVLADALAYADAVLDPDVVVDVATLTGAATQGLGRRFAALFTPSDELAAELLAAGEDSGERAWRLPLVADYRPALNSPVADLSNVSRDKRTGAGAITAALFLQAFVGRRRWAHLDIAGPARADADEHEVNKGGTGFGARLLLRWLERFAR